MQKRINKMILLFGIVLMFCMMASNTTQAVAVGELQLAYQHGGVVTHFTMYVDEKTDLRFFGAPDNWRTLNPRWFSSDKTVAEVDNTGLITAKSSGTVCVLLLLDNGMIGKVFVDVVEKVLAPEPTVTPVPTLAPIPAVTETPQKEPTIKEETTEEFLPNQVVLKNQEVLRVPSGATMSDGMPLKNLRDIAGYAFTFMMTDGTPVLPTYAGNSSGVAEIVSVEYRKNSNTIIVQNIYFKVFLDLNQDGWVSSEEKTAPNAGYYYIVVEVNKTLKVEDETIIVP